MGNITNTAAAVGGTLANGFTSVFDGSVDIWVAASAVVIAIGVVVGIFKSKRKAV